MRRPFSIHDILNSPCGAINQHLAERAKDVGKVGKYSKLKKLSKEKDWLLQNLTNWCNENGYDLKTELKFHPARKFSFDYAIEEIKTAIEYEGIFSKKSRHTTVTGYSKDTEKYNLAAAMGWKVLRVTAMNYKTVLETLNQIIEV